MYKSVEQWAEIADIEEKGNVWFTEYQTNDLGISFRIRAVLESKKTPFQLLTVIDTYEFGKIMLLDNAVMVSDREEFLYHEYLAHIPMSAHPAPKDILVIGGGDGGTVREILKHPSVESVKLVEIDREVVEAARKYFPDLSYGLDDSRVEILYTDGIKFVQSAKNKFDIILVDSTDPRGPAVGLFSPQFYKDAHKALKEGGILSAQTESPVLHPTIFEEIYSSLAKAFGAGNLWTYLGWTPLYPSGMWSFCFAGKNSHPLKNFDANRATQMSQITQWFNSEVHKAAFAAPNYIKDLLPEGTEQKE